MMRTIGEINPIEEVMLDKCLYRAVDSSTPQFRVFLSEILPEVVNGKIAPTFRERDQASLNELARAGAPLADFIESTFNFFRDRSMLLCHLEISLDYGSNPID